MPFAWLSTCRLKRAALNPNRCVFRTCGVDLPALASTGHIELLPIPVVDAVRLACSGGMEDGRSVLAVLLNLASPQWR